MSTAAVSVRTDEARMSLVEHLTELRDRLIKIVAAVALGMIVSFVLYPQIFDFLIGPYQDQAADSALAGGKLLILDPLEGFSVRMKLAMYGGVAFAMPVILWQIWRFVSPGLYKHEKKYAVPFLLSAILLFLMGAYLAYWTLPKALEWLADIGGSNITQAYTAEKYYQLIAYMMLAFGIAFEFPILLIFLQIAGIVSNETLRKYWRHTVVVIAIVVAVATPSADPISMMALCVPLWLFYATALLYGWARERRKRRAATTS